VGASSRGLQGQGGEGGVQGQGEGVGEGELALTGCQATARLRAGVSHVTGWLPCAQHAGAVVCVWVSAHKGHVDKLRVNSQPSVGAYRYTSACAAASICAAAAASRHLSAA
jgi:hypothetical protein